MWKSDDRQDYTLAEMGTAEAMGGGFTGGLGVRRARRAKSVEWPTILVAVALYGAFALLTWFHDSLPWWLLLPLGAYVVCLQGSLQHEAVHGHPTAWPLVNELLVLPNLWLWMPFRTYRRTHLTHHADSRLTDPLEDPESFYFTPEQWRRLGNLERGLFWLHNTVAGRLLLGPLVCVWRFASAEARRVTRKPRALASDWLPHIAGMALVLGWVLWICGMPLVEYLAFFAFPGISLTLLRSFLEHQARAPIGERTVLIEAGPLFSLLFFNNNLHAMHHAEPGLAWYKLPARYRERREDLLAKNGHYLYSGYAEIIARYLLWPKEPPVHPATAEGAALRLDHLGRSSGAPIAERHAFSPSKFP